jgi:transposase
VEAGEALADQPGPRLRQEKKARDRLIAQAARNPDWVVGFQDECWWSRLAQPDLFAWAAGDPLRLAPPVKVKGDGPSALACYGIYRQDTGGMLLRFVNGRPVSQVTEDFLAWACGVFAAEGKKVFVLVWDNAAWHVSQRVRAWIARHNRRVRRAKGGCRIRVCGLPIKAPWLNPIEPKWAHGKRAIVEPDRKLTPDEVKDRVCAHFGCVPTEPLKQAVG